MKGIILGAGLGTRLYPSTLICNKHLEVLYDKPVIYYSVSLLMKLDIKEIIIVSRFEDIKIYKCLLQDGKKWGISISYVIQDEAKGIVDGIKKCRNYFCEEGCVVCLGDNFIYHKDLTRILTDRAKKEFGAIMTCLKRDYGHCISTVKFDKEGNVLDLVRKNGPQGEYISPGVYYYDKYLWDVLTKMEGDTPWVEVNKEYLSRKKLDILVLSDDTIWHDVGVPDERLCAEEFIAKEYKNSNKLLGCPEEIAYKKGWISSKALELLIKGMPKCQYKMYLKELVSDISLE